MREATPTPGEAALDARLIAAHAAGDLGALVRLYREAGDAAASAGNEDAAGFYLTHAYIFALDAGDPGEEALRARLIGMGREAPLRHSP